MLEIEKFLGIDKPPYKKEYDQEDMERAEAIQRSTPWKNFTDGELLEMAKEFHTARERDECRKWFVEYFKKNEYDFTPRARYKLAIELLSSCKPPEEAPDRIKAEWKEIVTKDIMRALAHFDDKHPGEHLRVAGLAVAYLEWQTRQHGAKEPPPEERDKTLAYCVLLLNKLLEYKGFTIS